jgi:four helix bundle protein
MADNVLLEKSYKFAIRIVNLGKYLEKKRAYVLKDQIIRSGTSIGSNAEELVGASSNKDFLNKANISYREARETHYWIRLLRDTDYITKSMAESMLKDVEELIKIIGAIQSTMRKRLTK